MKFSDRYGPQFDPQDGTIGELKLVRRWVVMQEAGEGDQYNSSIFTARQGRYTFATRKEADRAAELYARNNDVSQLRQLIGRSLGTFAKMALYAAPMWCYPGHHDPAGLAPQRARSRRHPIDQTT